MCLTGTLLRSVLVVLLLANTCGKRRCNYTEILGSYREVILVELQNLNLTGSFNAAKDRDPCPPGKARRILVSIYGMTQQIRCQRNGKKQSDLERPVESMEQLIIHNCSPDYLGKRTSCSAIKKIRGKKRKRIRLIKVIEALITCWQKLQSVYMLSK
ncbi:probable basic-leucine zipper transcription factor R isoform X2 [Lates japonicus]|uniref:Probable basic-leucine zipper transcription factor R isoform X2 n=1 Tax=Lates japonicus TaxID=270547 RepID=A0AAD3QVW2_LATJO|nr:probable basic-leucine zipper transcription factor R isoform X2 [Lates japonicus]